MVRFGVFSLGCRKSQSTHDPGSVGREGGILEHAGANNYCGPALHHMTPR